MCYKMINMVCAYEACSVRNISVSESRLIKTTHQQINSATYLHVLGSPANAFAKIQHSANGRFKPVCPNVGLRLYLSFCLLAFLLLPCSIEDWFVFLHGEAAKKRLRNGLTCVFGVKSWELLVIEVFSSEINIVAKYS